MLELRPDCENCQKPLTPNATDAMICSFECTFCADCVNRVLANVCPNCGGGFCARPVRPARNWKGENYLGKYGARTEPKHRPVDAKAHAAFASSIHNIPPQER
ncbi:DUF1272 domain-containing protein [Sphaerotilaceae bacterium SBD11-9]